MTGERIVVGIDGSADSREALEWAIAHAGPADTIELVHTWNAPMTAIDAGLVIDPSIFEDSAKAVMNEELDLAKSRHVGLKLTGRIAMGHPGATLIAAAEGADMLVVGTRGRGGFAGLLLGSTSTYLAHHASCPLVIVRAEAGEDAHKS